MLQASLGVGLAVPIVILVSAVRHEEANLERKFEKAYAADRVSARR